MSTLEERLEKLESRLDGKNWWEKLDVVGTLAVAVAIGLAGHWFSSRTAAAQVTSAERLADRDREISVGNFRVEQARLISTFLEALVSDDAPRRKLAVKAILIALPDEGTDIVRLLSSTDSDPGVQAFAASTLVDRRSELIKALFDADAAVRIKAAQDLIAGWQSRPELVQPLISFARGNPSNGNGVYNTVAVLSALDDQALKPNAAAVSRFLDEAEANGERTRALVDKVRAKLQ